MRWYSVLAIVLIGMVGGLLSVYLGQSLSTFGSPAPSTNQADIKRPSVGLIEPTGETLLLCPPNTVPERSAGQWVCR